MPCAFSCGKESDKIKRNFVTFLKFLDGGNSALPIVRKILVSVIFLSAILGPEMGASILWTPGTNALFLQEKPMSIKFLVLGGGGYFGLLGGECRFYFYGRADFSEIVIGFQLTPILRHQKFCFWKGTLEPQKMALIKAR